MKACPFCEAELRDSVIRCTRCGRSLRVDRGSTSAPASAVTAASGSGGPFVPASLGASLGTPSRTAASAPSSPVWAVSTRAPSVHARTRDHSARRALPSDRRRSGRPDLGLWLAAAASIVAAVFAWQAIGEPWVRLLITDTSDRADPRLVGSIALDGRAALIGVVGQAVTVALGVFGVAWLFYGFDRGSTIPWFLSPVIPILAAIAAILGVVLAATVWFVWESAAVEHARAVRLSMRELRALLDTQPAPLVEIERLSGLLRFGGAMLVGLLAACTAWWSAHKRS